MKKNKNKNKAKIKCNVITCENNNFQEGTCCLEEICISGSCDCHDCDDTICQSFKETSSIINDNIYEVDSETEK